MTLQFAVHFTNERYREAKANQGGEKYSERRDDGASYCGIASARSISSDTRGNHLGSCNENQGNGGQRLLNNSGSRGSNLVVAIRPTPPHSMLSSLYRTTTVE